MQLEYFPGLPLCRNAVTLRVRACRIAAYGWVSCHHIDVRQVRGRRGNGRIAHTTDGIANYLIGIALIRDTSLIAAWRSQQIRSRNIGCSPIRHGIVPRQYPRLACWQHTVIAGLVHDEVGNKDSHIVILQDIMRDINVDGEGGRRAVTTTTIHENAAGGSTSASCISVTGDRIIRDLALSTTRDLNAVLSDNRREDCITLTGPINRTRGHRRFRTRAVNGNTILLIAGDSRTLYSRIPDKVLGDEAARVGTRPVFTTNLNADAKLATIQTCVLVMNVRDLIFIKRSCRIIDHQHTELIFSTTAVARQRPGNGQALNLDIRA